MVLLYFIFLEYPTSQLFVDNTVYFLNYQNNINDTIKINQNICGATYQVLKYNIQPALDILSSLPKNQINTASICYDYGTLYFHNNNYNLAIEWYEKMQQVYNNILQIAPYHLKGLDKLSTCYWHKNNIASLSILTNTLLNYEPLSEITWIVTGNYYSLLKDHVKAVKYIKRAIEINPYSIYSYILIGHEYTYIDDFNKALQSFESALSLNPRSYLAWYGIATIYFEQELYKNSLYHYLKASEIFPKSITLLSYLATVYQSIEDIENSEKILLKANELSPNDPQICFQLCELYYNTDKYEDAYKYSQILLRKSYSDPNVFFKIYLDLCYSWTYLQKIR